MKTLLERIARAPIRQPSISRCGLRPMSSRSLNAPGSDSSAFTTRYDGRAPLRSTSDALRPVGKPAPPRPRSVDVDERVDQRFGVHLLCLLERVVTADGAVLVELRQVALVRVREEDVSLGHAAPPRAQERRRA